MAGLFGSYAAGFLNDIFGVGSLLWPLVFGALGLAYLRPSIRLKWSRWWGYFLLSLCLLTIASSLDFSVGDLSGGGVLGASLYANGKRYLSPVGSFILWTFVFMIGCQLAGGFSWINLFHAAKEKWRSRGKDGAPKISFDRLKNLSDLPGKLARAAVSLAENLQAKKPKKATSPKPAPFPAIDFPYRPDNKNDDDPLASAEIIVNSFPEPAPPESGESVKDFKEVDSETPIDIKTEQNPEPENLTSAVHEEIPEYEFGEISEIPEIVETPVTTPQTAVLEPEIEPIAEEIRATKTTGERVKDEESAEEVGPAPLPPLSLLVGAGEKYAPDMDVIRERGRALMECLNNFDVKGELARVTPGPVITMYEVRPAPGTKVSKIAGLSDDLAMALKAVTVRIQAPVPGSDTVGVEIPNERRETVNFRELAETSEFIDNPGALTMILGKNIAGQPYMADLAKMPHLLVAGSTGAGKSVCLNSIIISLLYKLQPEDMRLMLIDPKRVEMGVYSDLPHLVHPVVTEMSDAKNALDWAVHEMERRFKTMKILGARDITSYNQKLAGLTRAYSPETEELKPFPYLVIIIDELADLMMTAARDVESSIVRLGQLGRAGGIHMILATQRPSVDVVTSLIKTNMGSRISFQVMSKYDSRTILDQVGAERLLGKGDMLFKPTSGRLQRLHGPFLSDDEVRAVVDYWKSYRKPAYDVDFSRWNGDRAAAGGAADNASDALYDEAKEFVLAQGKVSISLLQRHLRIGFVRAARIVEQFERDGIVGPADGSKPREVYR